MSLGIHSAHRVRRVSSPPGCLFVQNPGRRVVSFFNCRELSTCRCNESTRTSTPEGDPGGYSRPGAGWLRYRRSPRLLACSSHRNRFRYGLHPELQSLHRLSQSGRLKSHMHSLSTLIGRELFSLDRASKMKSARQLRPRVAGSSEVLIMGWTHFSTRLPRKYSKAKDKQQSIVPVTTVCGLAAGARVRPS